MSQTSPPFFKLLSSGIFVTETRGEGRGRCASTYGQGSEGPQRTLFLSLWVDREAEHVSLLLLATILLSFLIATQVKLGVWLISSFLLSFTHLHEWYASSMPDVTHMESNPKPASLCSRSRKGDDIVREEQFNVTFLGNLSQSEISDKADTQRKAYKHTNFI